MTAQNGAAADPGFAADEIAKSNLLLEAQLLRARRQTDEAAVKFARAARLEERLGAACLENGLRADAWVHRFSAASCWAQAGNFHEAITLGEELLGQPDLAPGLREQIREYTSALRRKRGTFRATSRPSWVS